jgi:hypothetical protein
MADQQNSYVVPDLCIGTWRLNGDDKCLENEKHIQEEYIAEQLEISGVTVNVFKLLGVHEQGHLIDLTGNGFPLSGGTMVGYNSSNAFDISPLTWRSSQTGLSVLTTPAFLGYNFGTKKTVYSTESYAPPAPIRQHITTLKIKQGALSQNRATQIRIEQADGKVFPLTTAFSGVGNGVVKHIQSGPKATVDLIVISATSPTTFSVTSNTYGFLGTATVGIPFNNIYISFIIENGIIPFSIGDTFYINLQLVWNRVDVVNLPDTNNLETIHFKSSSPAQYWRIVPLMFNGVSVNEPWEIDKLELIDYQATHIDNIQDIFFLENRDRDYSQISSPLKCQYSPFDSVGDLGKFGLNILDQYIFTVSFAKMVESLGRPIVTGDILELPSESQYDHNLKPIKKYLEVTDTSWSAEGFSPQWKPLIYRFQAEQLIPSTEHRDILGTRDTALKVDDSTFLEGIQQIETVTLQSSENIQRDADSNVPEVGAQGQEIASGMAQKILNANERREGSYDGNDIYIEDAIPPDGIPYTEGYKLPVTAVDGEYYRLLYPDYTKIPARLYKYSAIKNKWIYVETDRRGEYSSFKPSIRSMLRSTNKKSLKE